MQNSRENDKSESVFVRELSHGNILAFNTLFKKYSGRLYRFAYCYLKSEEESEEIVQEVFTIIWEKRFELKEALSFKSYLFTISFNMIRKHFRKKAYLAGYLNSRLYSESDSQTSESIIYNSAYQYIGDLIDKLPRRRKEIFIKSRFEGMKISEIAEELNISHKTIENQLTEALRFLRKNLKKEDLILILFFSLFVS
jgi:RNA polymerase sigma-70 factor (family 1)